MLKWILIGCAVVFLCCVLVAVGGAFWVFNQAKATPTFYKEVAAIELSDEMREATVDELRELAAVVSPSMLLSSEVDEDASDDGDAGERTTAEPATGDDVDELTPTEQNPADDESGDSGEPSESRPVLLTISEAQLNAYAALGMERLTKQVRRVLSDPRIRVQPNALLIGIRFRTPQLDGVVSIRVVPEVRGPRKLALLLQEISLGKVSISAEQAMASVDLERSKLPEGIEIPEGVSPPQVVLSWDHLDSVAAEVESLALDDQQVEATLFVTPQKETSEPETPADGSESSPAEGNRGATDDSQQNANIEAATVRDSPVVGFARL